MAVDVGVAYLQVVPSAKGFTGKLQRELSGGMASAGRDAGTSAARGFGGSFSEGVKRAAKAGAAAVAGLVGLAGGAALFGLKTAAANEQAQISFETMLGSGEKAGKFLKDLQSFAAKTPFEFPELQTAASSLISAGINANKVIPIMTTLGDVTSGMGTGSEGVQRATIALQQMSAAGRITGEDLNQLRDAGIPVYDLLSKATGKSKEEVVKLAQAGKLGKKELGQMMTALETGKGLERFSGLMDKQSSSLSGLVSTFKDTFGQGLAKAVEPAIPLLKEGLLAASEKLAEIMPKVGEWIKKVAENAKQFITEFQNGTGAGGDFRDQLEDIVAKAKDVAKWIGDNADTIKTLVFAVGSAVAIFKTVTTAVRAWRTVQLLLNVALSANPIGLVITALGLLVAGIIYAYNESETFRNVVDTALKGIAAAWRWLWNSIIAPIIRFILNGFADLTGGIASFLRALSNIPGFGWAKDAADKMDGAADKARGLARGILDIPSDKQVTITIQAKANDLALRAMNLASSGGSAKARAIIEGRHTGGPVSAGGVYAVGENADGSWNRTTELFVPKTAGTVFTQDQLAAMGGGSRFSQYDIERLAAAVANVQVSANISAGSFDRAMGVRL